MPAINNDLCKWQVHFIFRQDFIQAIAIEVGCIHRQLNPLLQQQPPLVAFLHLQAQVQRSWQKFSGWGHIVAQKRQRAGQILAHGGGLC